MMACPINRQKHLVHVPFVRWPGTTAPELIGKILSKLLTAFANGLIRHRDAMGEKQLFVIVLAQTEAEVQPDAVADNFSGEAVVYSAPGSLEGSCLPTFSACPHV
jgi:hypothetical protein